MTDLTMFGELEDTSDDRMVVRAVGYVLGSSAGWVHYQGLSVIFPEFQTKHAKLVDLLTGIPADRLCLGIDFYTGEVKIIEAARDMAPKVHHTLQLGDLLR